jgi:hypothetical protein
MSKRKSNEPELELRTLNRYSVEQVVEVARMLYALAPFEWDDFPRWDALVRQAYTWLDNAHYFCEAIGRERSARDASFRRAKKRSAELKRLADIVPYKKAVCRIMNDRHFPRVLPRFKNLVCSSPLLARYFDLIGVVPGELLKRWPKEGIPLHHVHELHSAHERQVESERQKLKAKLAKKRKRKPRLPIKPWGTSA